MSTLSTHRLYRVNCFGAFEEIEVASESARFVTLPNGRREVKESTWAFYSETKAECKRWLISQCETAVKQAKRDLEYAEKKLANAKAIEVL